MSKLDNANTTQFNWNFPEIGTCGKATDLLRISIMRTRAIPDLLISFDGERDGWVIYGSFPTACQTEYELKEVGFIPEFDDDAPFDAQTT